jgi:non-specific serine/threonine protein kinase/serine/threonine-protein kinase
MSDQPHAPRPPSDDVTRPDTVAAHASPTIGPYRLLERIGEGGMGQVWRAEQMRPVRRQVALKVIKAGMDTAHVMARFEAERQALAVMDHPAIARVFDGGTSPAGRPYFVMEYVPGEALTTYCNRHRLSTRERLDLFLQVCDGVQHAHQKGIIHRDLKPSNILVTLLDGHPVPKIIDFGVAKAVAQPLTDRPLYTELGTIVGTLEYMSPEQAELTGLDIDTRADVYALGVVLYELLTGMLPFDSSALRQKGLDEVRRTIREVEPPRPSARVTLETSTGRSTSQRPDLAGLARELQRDLDWITMKALEKDRTRRYGAAAELAADVGRYLDNRPVAAGPPSAAYRAGKFIRRHRLGVSAAATVVTLLVVFAITVGIQARRIAAERDRASREASIARAVNDFLQSDLLAAASANQQARPDTRPDPDLTVRTALDRAAAGIEGKFQEEPLVEAAIRLTMGITYRDLGLYAEAQPHVDRARTLRRQALGDEHPDTLRSAAELALLRRRQGDYPGAEALLTDGLDALRHVRGDDHAETLAMMVGLAGVYQDQGKYAEAEPLLTTALEGARRTVGDDDPETLARMNNLALLYQSSGKLDLAEPLLASALAARRRVSGDEHPETLTVMNNLASQYYRRGMYAEAGRLFVELVERRRRVLGADHPATLIAMNNLAVVYRAEGRNAEAEPIITEVLEIRRRVLGEEHPDTLRSEQALAGLHGAEGRHAEAEARLARVLDARRRVVGAEHPDTSSTMMALGRARLLQEKYTSAARVLADGLNAYERALPRSWERFQCQALLGASLAGDQRYTDAERHLLSGYEGMNLRQATMPPDGRSQMDDAAARLARLYSALNRPDKAAEWAERAKSGPVAPASNPR